MVKFAIVPIDAPIQVIMASTIVNSVATLPTNLAGTHICVPFHDYDPFDTESYDMLTLEQWSELQTTPEWTDLEE